MTDWRLILSQSGTGSENMALDEALWENYRKTGRPFLRFYTWSPAALSIGRFQNLQTGLRQDVFPHLPRVRRITGGGAIWHDRELTYSLACDQSDLKVAGVKASFEKLTTFLLETWRSMGLEADYAKNLSGLSELGNPTAACFAGKEEYDILVQGKKLGGNAQSRARHQIFQHGSIPLYLDYNLLDRLFLPGYAPQPELTTSLNELGWTGKTNDLMDKLTAKFQENLKIRLNPSPLDEIELERQEELISERSPESLWFKEGSGSLR